MKSVACDYRIRAVVQDWEHFVVMGALNTFDLGIPVDFVMLSFPRDHKSYPGRSK